MDKGSVIGIIIIAAILILAGSAGGSR